MYEKLKEIIIESMRNFPMNDIYDLINFQAYCITWSNYSDQYYRAKYVTLDDCVCITLSCKELIRSISYAIYHHENEDELFDVNTYVEQFKNYLSEYEAC